MLNKLIHKCTLIKLLLTSFSIKNVLFFCGNYRDYRQIIFVISVKNGEFLCEGLCFNWLLYPYLFTFHTASSKTQGLSWFRYSDFQQMFVGDSCTSFYASKSSFWNCTGNKDRQGFSFFKKEVRCRVFSLRCQKKATKKENYQWEKIRRPQVILVGMWPWIWGWKDDSTMEDDTRPL